MTGALIQLVAYGIQDLYLTGAPQITFFKIVYRRHTNFSVDSVRQNFTSPADFGKIVTCNISRAGDLIGKTYLYIQIPEIPRFIDIETGEEDHIKKFAWVENLGYALIQEITVEIGGKLIDRHYGEFMYIWEQVSGRQPIGINKMIGNVPEMHKFSNGKPGYLLYVPLKFWFCRHTGLSLPLIALASSDVKINIMFRRFDECYRMGPTFSIELIEDVCPFRSGDYIEQIINGKSIYGYCIDYDYIKKRLYYIKIQNINASKKNFDSLIEPSLSQGIINSPTYSRNILYRIYNSLNGLYCTPKPNTLERLESTMLPYIPTFVNSFLYVNYVYLDTDERLKFARSNHEYLIEQLQYNQEVGIGTPNVKQNLALMHPCKEHFWIVQLDSLVGPRTINDLFNYTDSHIRYPDGRFYGRDLVETATLILNGKNRFGIRNNTYFNKIVPWQCHFRSPVIGINDYSFCLFPEDHQPSASCNMRKIDFITMNMRLGNVINTQNTCKVRAYTINYNILRIFFNLGGLAFM